MHRRCCPSQRGGYPARSRRRAEFTPRYSRGAAPQDEVCWLSLAGPRASKPASSSLLGARHSVALMYFAANEDAPLEWRAPSHERVWRPAVRQDRVTHVHRPARRRLVQPVARLRRRRPVRRRPAAGRRGGARRARPRGPVGLRQGLWRGRHARSRPGRQRKSAQAPHRRRQGQPHRFRRVPSRLSRPDGQEHRPRHPCLGA